MGRRHSAWNECYREWGGLREFTAENIEAALKSAEILYRGVRVLNLNMHGAARMTVDDGVSASRALMDCRTVQHWTGLQCELVKLNTGRATIRTLLLSIMTLQVAEEALFPLIRRAGAAHGLLARTVAT